MGACNILTTDDRLSFVNRPRVLFDYLQNTRKCAGLVKVVHVQNADVFGPRHADAFVQRIGLPTVALRYPSEMRMRLADLTEDLHGSISGTAVNNNVLDPSAVLSRDGFYAPSDVPFAVINRGNDAECWYRSHVAPRVHRMVLPKAAVQWERQFS